MMSKQRWYWCQDHERAEPAEQACPRDRRLGPYDSREAAEKWQVRHEEREDRWEEQDEEWESMGVETPDED